MIVSYRIKQQAAVFARKLSTALNLSFMSMVAFFKYLLGFEQSITVNGA